MLSEQTEPVQLMGMEAARLQWWHVSSLWHLRPKQMFFAYDDADDFEPLIEAGKMLRRADFTRSHLRCYVLMGYDSDTFDDAEDRMVQAWDAGFLPFGMLWMDDNGKQNPEWTRFQRTWTRPAAIKSRMKALLTDTGG